MVFFLCLDFEDDKRLSEGFRLLLEGSRFRIAGAPDEVGVAGAVVVG